MTVGFVEESLDGAERGGVEVDGGDGAVGVAGVEAAVGGVEGQCCGGRGEKVGVERGGGKDGPDYAGAVCGGGDGDGGIGVGAVAGLDAVDRGAVGGKGAEGGAGAGGRMREGRGWTRCGLWCRRSRRRGGWTLGRW